MKVEQVAADIGVIAEAYALKAWEMFVRLWGWIRWEVWYRFYARFSVEYYEQERERRATHG